jgi:hypothetical protein
VPFYDYDLLNFALKLPENLRLNMMLYREAVVKLLPDLAHLPRTPHGDHIMYVPSDKPSFLRTLKCSELIMRKRNKKGRIVQDILHSHVLPLLGRSEPVDYQTIFQNNPGIRSFLEKAYPPNNPWFASNEVSALLSHVQKSRGKTAGGAVYRLSCLLTLALYRKQIGWR